MSKQSFVKRTLLRLVEEDVKSAIKEEKSKWAEESVKELAKSQQTLGRIREYTPSYGDKKKTFKAAEASSNKKWGLLYTIYSEAPGSMQSCDRIRSAVVGKGYILKPTKNGKKSVKQFEELTRLCERTNPEATIEDLVKNMVTNFFAVGNSYTEIVGTVNGRSVAELYTLSSDKVKILVDAEKRRAGVNVLLGYELLVDFVMGSKPEDKSIIYSANEVMHLRRTDEKGGLYGKAVFEDNQSVMQLILQSLAYNIKTFENQGKPPLQVRLPDGTSSTEAIEFSNFFEKNFSGVHNAGKTLILYNNANAEILGLSPADIEYLKLLEFGLKQVSGMYGVPMVMISQPEGSNKATSQEETKGFYQRVVKPLRKYITDKLNQEIVKDRMGITDWKIDFQDIELEDSRERSEEASKTFMYGTRSWNEARDRMGLQQGDEPWMEEFYVVHNGIATPLKDFGVGGSKKVDTQADRQKAKEDTKKSEEVKTEDKKKAKKNASKENDELNKGEVIHPNRGDNHEAHIKEHKKVLFTIKDKYRASLRVHIFGHEDFLWEQDSEGNYGRANKK